MSYTQLRLFARSLIVLLMVSHSSLSASSLLDSLGIEVRGKSRAFVYTNKESAFLYGETGRQNTTGWQGFNVFGHEFLDDYAVLIDEKPLERATALRTVVFPDVLVRYYPDGVTEEVRMVDSLPLFAVSIHSTRSVSASILPFFTDGGSQEEYELSLTTETALIAQRTHLERTTLSNYPVWLAIGGKGFAPLTQQSRKDRRYSPLRMHTSTGTSHTIVFAVADNRDEAQRIIRMYTEKPKWYRDQRRARLEKLLNLTQMQTADPQFDKALMWAKISLDALIMNQTGRGIFAGLPWFNNYWGRDTFISLPGATLVTGQFDLAREILRSFATFQERDSLSSNYGRIPNIVTTTDKAYNTADGTPRFVIMAHEYAVRSGDERFIAEIYPVIVRTIEGTLRWHTDSLGFLTHGAAETWMDAVGPAGPWSPRGNRANDIQALWAGQLDAGKWFADRMGDRRAAMAWEQHLLRLRANFQKLFVRNGECVDHLRADGSPAPEMRPNQIFASPLLTPVQRAGAIRNVVTQLTFPYGVASLAPHDPDFHPYHEYAPYYPKDAAYHNGTVWTWLQGPLISELCAFQRQETAYRLTEDAMRQILTEGAVGTQSELLDAIPRPGTERPRTSGTVSQAWNLAEFVRNVYDDYLGIKLDQLRHMMVLAPRLPRSLGRVKAVMNLNGRRIPLTLDVFSKPQTVTIDGTNLTEGITVSLELPGSTERTTKLVHFPLHVGSQLKVVVADSTAEVVRGGLRHSVPIEFRASETADLIPDSLPFASSVLPQGLKALRGPDYPLLPHRTITSWDSTAKQVVLQSDPEGDDTGVGPVRSRGSSYTYPLSKDFVPGCLDLTRFGVWKTDSMAYFELRLRRLSDPGWHPEYGFQLTIAAIAIDEDRTVGMGMSMIEHNATYRLAGGMGYERLLLVGGGVQVEDSSGKILMAYVPTPGDVSHPFGNAGAGVIRFALPIRLLGSLDRAHFTVIVGAQDDHGGAGIGEFRAVQRDRGEWNGDGRATDSDTNVYDELEAP